MEKLSAKALQRIKPDEVKMRICLEVGISYGTFRRWLKTKSEVLKRSDVVKAISVHAKMKEEEVLLESKKNLHK